MKISSESAQSIVMEIGNIVGQNINMMDEKGYIIASTDPDRVGSFHEGARRILDRQLDELYIKPEDRAAYYVINSEYTGKVEF